MYSPVVICCGVIRSGSTWSFNVCRLLGELLAKRRAEQAMSCYLDEPRLEEFLRAGAYLGSGPSIIKSHATGTLARQWIHTGRAKGVCTFRDPRDCIASDVEFWNAGLEASVQRVWESFGSLGPRCRDFGRTLFVRYEDMMKDRPCEIRRIAAHLNVRVDPNEVEWIDQQTNIQTSRQVCQTIGSLGQDQAPTIVNNHRRHTTTLLHENHIGSGKPGRWKEELPPDQAKRLTEMFKPCLLDLGYE